MVIGWLNRMRDRLSSRPDSVSAEIERARVAGDLPLDPKEAVAFADHVRRHIIGGTIGERDIHR
jgi:hypothetical protein